VFSTAQFEPNIQRAHIDSSNSISSEEMNYIPHQGATVKIKKDAFRNANYAASITIAVAVDKLWPDVLEVFRGSGERDCWCQYWRQSASAYANGTLGPGKANLRKQVKEGPPPGVLAYVDGKPVGWLGLWPRERMERLVRSRTIPKLDERQVWSIVCFMVRVGYRKSGVTKALLDGAIDFARKTGVPSLEAYPIDTEGRRVDVTFGYVGFAHVFEAAGFQRIFQTDARSARRPRILMRLDL
jgi:GNAT superfamily N-acetyltransferase